MYSIFNVYYKHFVEQFGRQSVKTGDESSARRVEFERKDGGD